MGDPFRVSAGVIIFRFQGRDQTLDRLGKSLIELFEKAGVFKRENCPAGENDEGFPMPVGELQVRVIGHNDEKSFQVALQAERCREKGGDRQW